MLVSIYFFILLELLVVSYSDVIYKKIYNIWSVLNILMYLVFLLIIPDSYFFSFEHWFYSLVFIFVGFLLFVLKIMGGGDAKFLATLFLIIPTFLHDKFLLLLLFSTIFIGGTMLLYNFYEGRFMIKRAWQERDVRLIKGVFGTKFSYAPVILLAWIWLGWEFLQITVKK